MFFINNGVIVLFTVLLLVIYIKFRKRLTKNCFTDYNYNG